MKHTVLITLLTAALLLAAGCAQKEQTEDTSAAAETQTALETVADVGEHEIRLPLVDEGMTVPAKVQDSGMHPDFPPKTTRAATAAQTTAPSAQTTASTTAKADNESVRETSTTTKPAAVQNPTTTTTKPALSQNTTTTTAASGGQTATVSTTTANGTPKTTSAATLPTADAEKDRYELPAIPLG